MASERALAGGFTAGLIGRLLLLACALALLVAAVLHPGLAAARLLAALLAAGAAAALWRHVTRTNRELARFVDALRFGDLSQGFARRQGGGFDALGQALDAAMRSLRAARSAASDEARIQAALLEESPAALLLVDDEGRVTLANKAARKLFDRLPGTRAEDFADYGSEIVALLDGGAAARALIRLRTHGVAQRAAASRTVLDHGGRRLSAVAVQPIQHELSAVELAAQADLVRVLTHEIMNSMTPVVSLAASAATLMRSIRSDDPDVADARLAVETLARRAGGIMRFVEAYREFARVPELHRRPFAAAPWADEIARLFAASTEGQGVPLAVAIVPPDMMLDADPDLLSQVVLNLLKNGAEAARDRGDPVLSLAIALLPGGRTRLTVRDNGPGIAAHLAEEIFLPFFTTKAGGTGVGLSLARRILAAHGGSIAAAPGVAGAGAVFELVL